MATTRAITRTSDAPEVSNTRLATIISLTWFILAFSLTAYCADWLAHDYAVYRLHTVAKDLREGRPASNSVLAIAFEQSLALDNAHRLRSVDLDDAAQVATQFASRNLNNRVFAPALLATVEHLLRERLALAPVDGNSWLRLAFVHTARAGLDPLSREALRMSWFTTPRELAVMWPSLKFRMSHWNELAPDERSAASDLVVGLWHKPPERDALLAYLAKLPQGQRNELFANVADPGARSALVSGLSSPKEPRAD